MPRAVIRMKRRQRVLPSDRVVQVRLRRRSSAEALKHYDRTRNALTQIEMAEKQIRPVSSLRYRWGNLPESLDRAARSERALHREANRLRGKLEDARRELFKALKKKGTIEANREDLIPEGDPWTAFKLKPEVTKDPWQSHAAFLFAEEVGRLAGCSVSFDYEEDYDGDYEEDEVHFHLIEGQKVAYAMDAYCEEHNLDIADQPYFDVPDEYVSWWTGDDP